MNYSKENMESHPRKVEGEYIPRKSRQTDELQKNELKGYDSPKSHVYSLMTILLGISFITTALSSLRGAAKIFKLIQEYVDIEAPSSVTIQNWLFRVGLYQLQKGITRQDDWIYIADNTVQLGPKKALVILGVTLKSLKAVNYRLKHTDVQVLKIHISEKITGEIIHEQLEDIAEKVGTPLQIVADKGPDINKGIELYKAKHDQIIYTYDITHKLANMLKKILEKDSFWQSFQTKAGKARKKAQQTELAHLVPPKQKIKARYLNADSLVQWGKNLISYQDKQDFSDIRPTYIISEEVIKKLRGIDKATKLQLAELEGEKYIDTDKFLAAVDECIGTKNLTKVKKALLTNSNIAKQRFEQHFSWITTYKNGFSKYIKLMKAVEIINEHIKTNGIHKGSANECKKKLKQVKSRNKEVIAFKDEIIKFLKVEGKDILKSQALLGTSDIIESIFGKYKYLDGKSGLKEIGKLILIIPVITTKLTFHTVKEALENVRQGDVANWFKKKLGKSNFSKRQAALGS